MSRNDAIVLYQPLLYSIALKMVGRLEDAEDIVQDTFEKWLSVDHSKVENTKAYLVRSVSNNCLNFLNSFWHRSQRSDIHEMDSQEIEDDHQVKSIFSFDLEAQLAEAWAVIHKKLEPLERQIYVMREVFNVEYDELQEIFDKKKDNCRQIVRRAKLKMRSDSERLRNALPRTLIPEYFRSACKMGYLSGSFSPLAG